MLPSGSSAQRVQASMDSTVRQPDTYSCERQVGEAALVGALRRRMEKTVLVLRSGSYAQRVQAEFLSELEARASKAFQNASQVS